jgi:hypothetical protein
MQPEEKSNERSEWDPHAVSPTQTEPTRTKVPRRPPPNHPVKTLFRVLLWFLPTGFAVLCIVGITMMGRRIIPSGFHDGVIWYLLTAAFTLGTGWYNALLSNKAKLEPDGIFGRTVLFFFIQHFLVLLLLATLLFAACLISPLKF